MNIAIVEDEAKLANVLAEYLQKESYHTVQYDNGEQALEQLRAHIPDLVLLDLMLPGVDGLTVCRELRKISNVPIIMLTARVEEIDRLLGLEIGADDYICKPYSPREVVARVKAVLRRTTITSNDVSNDGSGNDQPGENRQPLTLDEAAAKVAINNQETALTAVELELLKAMLASPGRIFNRTQLMNRIYPDNRIVSDRTIDSHIKKLRQKLQALEPDSEYIHSVYGIGYKFEIPNS